MNAAEEPLASVAELSPWLTIRNWSASAKRVWITTTPPTARRAAEKPAHPYPRRPRNRPAVDHPFADADDDMARILTEEYHAGAPTPV